jgi:Na+/H+ antiporter NhaD/arsenite permease-like protein
MVYKERLPSGVLIIEMSDINNGFAIATLILFFLSTIFVIQPLSFHVPLPIVRRTRITIGLITAPIIAILILWATQCIGATEIRDGIVGTGPFPPILSLCKWPYFDCLVDGVKPYNILILFISLAYIAITLDITGIFQAAAFWVSNQGGNNGRKLYFYFYLLLTVVSMVIGNDPVILSGTAFLVYYTSATGLEPVVWLVAEFAVANMASMVLFVDNPTNVVIREGFQVNNAAFTAYTILPFIACNLTCYAVLAFQFRNVQHIPGTFAVRGRLNPRKALRDPVSAIFGGILLLTCLTLVIVLSFLHVDIWKIVLPFAVTKFIFDLSWDHYRFTHGRLDSPQLERALSTLPGDIELVLVSGSASGSEGTVERFRQNGSLPVAPKRSNDDGPEGTSADGRAKTRLFATQRDKFDSKYASLAAHFPTFFTALPRLPFGLIPFTFSQFIIVEGLSRQGWIDIFAAWLVKKASHRQIVPTTWLVGILGFILCNVAGTNIGATILLTKVVRTAPNFPTSSARAAAIALAVASNTGAVSFTFSASLAGLLWKSILGQKGINVNQSTFAFWNCLPLLVMTGVGLAVVTEGIAQLKRALAAKEDNRQSNEGEDEEWEGILMVEEATSGEEEERPVRRSSKVKRDASGSPRKRFAVVDSTDDDEEDLQSFRSSSSKLRMARRKLLYSTSTRSAKVRMARRKLLSASLHVQDDHADADEEDDYHSPSPPRKSPYVRRKPQTSSDSLPRYEDYLMARLQGFPPMGLDSNSRPGSPIYMPGVRSYPYLPTYGPSFPTPSPIGPYGYDVVMPGSIVNGGVGNIINSTISNVGNDNSVDRRKWMFSYVFEAA